MSDLSDEMIGCFEPDLQERKVLIVDDLALVMLGLRSTLIDAGVDSADIIEATTGEEALSQWKKNNDQISVIITDNDMPVSGSANALLGIEVIEKISQIYNAEEREQPLMILHSNKSQDVEVIEVLDACGALGVKKNQLNDVLPEIQKALGVYSAPEISSDNGCDL
ncbi:MAG: hypothetical protein COA45_02940 [Zetaproteobacteria bacterium]|nr:MAG: hypothetical protein COA45_02940 [Zetaproteobacteria bacterium]